MRHIYQSTSADAKGNIIPSMTVSVFLENTITAANVYAASSGGSPVNAVTTSDTGSFSFWVDDNEYSLNQKFKITLTRTGYITKSYNNISVFSPVPSNTFYPDWNAADHGATTNAWSVKSIINLVGSDNVTIILRNNSGSITTPYLVATALTIPANVEIKTEIGSMFTKSGSGTLTINGPVTGDPKHQWLSGFAAGEVLFGSISEIYVDWFGAYKDGTNPAATTLAINIAIRCAFGTAYRRPRVIFSGGHYKVDGSCEVFHSGSTSSPLMVRRGIIMEGQGDGTILENVASAGKPTIILGNNSRGSRVKQMYICGTSAYPNVGIEIKESQDIDVEDVNFNTAGHSILLTTNTNQAWLNLLRFKNLHFWWDLYPADMRILAHTNGWDGIHWNYTNVGDLLPEIDIRYVYANGGNRVVYLNGIMNLVNIDFIGQESGGEGPIYIRGESGSWRARRINLHNVYYEGTDGSTNAIDLRDIDQLELHNVEPGGASGSGKNLYCNVNDLILTNINCSGNIYIYNALSLLAFNVNAAGTVTIDPEPDTLIGSSRNNNNAYNYIRGDIKPLRFNFNNPNVGHTFTNGDTTPSVSTGNSFRVENSSATSITTLDDGVIGQVVFLFFTNGNTTLIYSSSMLLRDKNNWITTEDDMIFLYCSGSGIWQELGRFSGKETGIGSPEGVITAPVGSVYRRTDGGAGTTLYIKESGTGNTGWIGK